MSIDLWRGKRKFLPRPLEDFVIVKKKKIQVETIKFYPIPKKTSTVTDDCNSNDQVSEGFDYILSSEDDLILYRAEDLLRKDNYVHKTEKFDVNLIQEVKTMIY